MRRALLALVLSGLSALACGGNGEPQCPGQTVALLRLKGPIAYEGDPSLAALDPVSGWPDCTPNPFLGVDPRYPHLLPPFDAKLTVDPATGAAALCRSNGIVYSGVRTGATHYEVEADASPAAPCPSSACAAKLRVIVRGDLSVAAGGAVEGFSGIFVEALAEEAGACAGCLPPVPATPATLACAARYALSGTAR